MSAARAFLDDAELKGEAVSAVKGSFYANTSRVAQSRKRQEVEDLARKATGSDVIFLIAGVHSRGGWLQLS